jgi:putative glutamine amidotransferase
MVTDDSFMDTYRFGNNYIKKIVENGAVPLLIPYVNEQVIEESLEMCDGLLLPGGTRIRPVDFEVIGYFYKRNKPILGICMGMQSIAMYSLNNKRIIKKIDNGVDHWPVDIKRDNVDTLIHKDYVTKDSKLYDILGSEEIMVNSLHHNTITEVGNDFDITIKSEDGLIEGIEYNKDDKFIIGVQFHPEILPQFNNLFKIFIEECQKRK